MLDRLKELVTLLAQSLVDNDEEVEVHVEEEDRYYVFELSVAEDDLGKVIGREGRTARALRTVLNAASSHLDKRVVLDILE